MACHVPLHVPLQCSAALLLYLQVVMASRPFLIEPPSEHSMPADDVNLSIDQIIRRVMDSHSNQPAMDSPETMAMLMNGDSSMRLAEMDMMLTKEQYASLYGSPPRPADAAHSSRDKRRQSRNKRKAYRQATPWSNNEIPYVLNPWDFSGTERAIIHLAMQEWEQYTCVKFRPSNSSDQNKLIFQNGIGCNSQLGQVGGPQALNLEAPGCRFKGLYLHEIGHALGLVHEHQLPDRDNHINIVWDNVKPEWKQWFNKYSSSDVVRDNLPYDLTSVMHYGITAFSYDDSSQTIKARDRSMEENIGRVYKKELSFTDIETVNTIYECNAHCPSHIECKDEGYVGRDCMCVCPNGGNWCQTNPLPPPIPDVTCQNAHSSDSECDKWANEDQCSLNPIWMIENCRRSCKKCDRVSEPKLPTKVCSNSFDSKDCDSYALAGECSANPAWMFFNCKASCGWCNYTSSCKDLYPDSTQCREWKGYGYCDRNPAWMWANCRQTCGICTNPPQGCENKAGDGVCFADASVGECENDPDYMLENCAMACGKCGSCYNEYKDDAVCIDLATAGECTLAPEWMGRYCKKACDACSEQGLPIGEARPCRDKNERCTEWSRQGECTANPSWMIPNCQKSCGKCECINQHSDASCDTWAQNGECENNTLWMTQNCQRSCRFCTNLPPPSDRCKNAYTQGDNKCEQWQQKGECFKNPLFMIPQCRKSCTMCDVVDDCDQWSAWSSWTGCSRVCGTGMRSRTRRCVKGVVRTEDEMVGCMISECPTTTVPTTIATTQSGAGTTATPLTTTEMIEVVPECRNKHQRNMDCDIWARYGHCESNPSWMHTNCARACQVCISYETCFNKYGDDEQCLLWANNNQCTANPSWMLSNCARACQQCEDNSLATTTVAPAVVCINSHHSNSQCEAWAKAGHCENSPGFMHVSCAKACGTCEDVPTITELRTTTRKAAVTTATTAAPPPPDCVDRHESCDAWAESSREYCTTSEYVKENCKTACGLCTSILHKEIDEIFITDKCYDKSTDCHRKASQGECISNSDRMKELCPYSCEYCQPSLCVNSDSNCERWAAAQACHIFPTLMIEKCRLACGYCINKSAMVTVSQP